MLSALRGIIQRWVGMTTEVQTVEPAEAPAVPGATPTCSADYAAQSSARRTKRAGCLTSEAADLKRPRTAPTTPIDALVPGSNPSAGKLAAPNSDDLRPRSLGIAGAGDIPTRPSAAVSAPAALNRSQRSQPSVSTSPAAASACGLGAVGAAPSTASSRHTTGAISGVVAAPPLQSQSQPQPQQQPHHPQRQTEECCDISHTNHQLPQQERRPTGAGGGGSATCASASLPLQLLPALHRAAGGNQHHQQPQPQPVAATGSGNGCSDEAAPQPQPQPQPPHPEQRGSGSARHPSPQHHLQSHSHEVALLQHHRHDPLEEQVFSPAFHVHSSPAGSPSERSRGGPNHNHQEQQSAPSNPPGCHQVVAIAVDVAGGGGGSGCMAGGSGEAAGTAPAVGLGVQSCYHHPGGPACMQLRAIDLNVVEGVEVDTEDDEIAVGGPGGVAPEPASREEEAQQRGSGRQEGQWAGPADGVTGFPFGGGISDGGVAAVGEELSSSSSGGDGDSGGAGAGATGAAQQRSARTAFAAVEEDEENEDYECGNDENAPVAVGVSSGAWIVAATTGGNWAAAAVGSASAQPRCYHHPQQQTQAQQQPQRTRAKRVAVSAAMQAPVQQYQPHPPPYPPSQGPRDNVLVASAPRVLAATVTAAIPAVGGVAASAAAAVAISEHQRSAAAGAAATGLEAEEEAEEQEDEEDEDDEDAFLEFDPLVFIKQLPPLEACVPPHRPVLLPRQARTMARRKTLVLDLDETLVHSSLEAVDRSDFSFPVVFNGTEHKVFVRQRPHLLEFMARVSAVFEVVVFTASQRIYAERLLDILDPAQELVRHRIYRDSCVVVDGNYLKDLSILGRDLAHTVIVDNSPQAFGFQVDNGIPIESWYDDDADTELLKLLPFLESLAAPAVDDVRPRIRQQFRLRELIDRA